MFFANESLNILSLLALMISVGLLVDNSVVVAENIHRLNRAGLARREAAIRGTAEIALAVVMATLTTDGGLSAGFAGRWPGPVRSAQAVDSDLGGAARVPGGGRGLCPAERLSHPA